MGIPVGQYNLIYFLDERGVTRSFKAGDSFELVNENKLEGERFWSSIALAGNSYIFKSAGKMYCVRR